MLGRTDSQREKEREISRERRVRRASEYQ